MRQFVFERFQIAPKAVKKSFGEKVNGQKNQCADKKSIPTRII